MKNGIWIPILLLAVSLLFNSCEKNSTDINNSQNIPTGTATLKLYLTDAPASEYDSVKITFSEVSAHLDSSWIILADTLMTVNLLELTNGNTVVIGSDDVPAGHYTQIRLKITDAWVVVDGIRHPMDVPSGSTSGLKFGPEFTLAEGVIYEMVVDFDVHRSIVTTGPPFNPKGYKLKPHIRISPLAISGSISGTITNPEHLPVAYAIQNDDTTTSSLPDSSSGYFKLSFLPAGEYTVSIRDTLDQSFEQSGVMVQAGANVDLDSLTLQ
ncbi:MAG: DUF4382 domain-containing protein [bacterium]|nr:MAG: DUF4382 domain-containing protein [bacterium]